MRRQRDELEIQLKEEREERRSLETTLADIKSEFQRITNGPEGIGELSTLLEESRHTNQITKTNLKHEREHVVELERKLIDKEHDISSLRIELESKQTLHERDINQIRQLDKEIDMLNERVIELQSR